MRTVTHREMRNSSGEILRAVAAGESILVTNNGQVAAMITPPPSTELQHLVESGAVRPARRPLTDLAAIQRSPATRSTKELLDDVRGPW